LCATFARVAAKRKTKGDKKRCARKGCGFKPRSEFPRNAALADGLGAYCRKCKRLVDREQRHPAAPADLKARRPENLSVPEPPRSSPGPRNTITAELTEAVCVLLRKGHSRRVAARLTGVSEDTFAVWMMRGREAKDDDSPTRHFSSAVLEAEGRGLHDLEEKAIAGAGFDHVQALRLLERRDPETWGKREVKAVGSDASQMDVADMRKLLTERLSRFIELPAEPPPATAEQPTTVPAPETAP
jgi:transposase